MIKGSQKQWSYREVLDAAGIEHDGPVAVMDARCGLCAKGARWIARNDRRNQFRIVPLQSDLGRALMAHFGLNAEDPASWLLLHDGHSYTSLAGFAEAGRILGGIWVSLSVLKVLPLAIQNGLYRLVARNRIRLFGRADLCNLPDAEVQKRLIQ